MFLRDWKKLTFYYFADEYINFNSLVTDLFKIYKTRIWMSAINPASFQTPLGGVQIPGGLNPTAPSAFSPDVDQYSNRRAQRQQPTPASMGPIQPAFGTFDHTWNAQRNVNGTNGMAMPQLYGQPFSGHDLDVRQGDQYPLDYRQGLSQVLGMNSSFSPSGYAPPNLHHSASFNSRPDSSNSGQHPQMPGRDWHQSFQDLSLGH